MGSGIVRVSGYNLYKTVRNLAVNRAGPFSAKDAIWKYKWVEKHEPEVFEKLYKWLDIGDYLVARCTGRIVRTVETAFLTFLYDARRGKEGWNKGLVDLYEVNPVHLPDAIDITEQAGVLNEKAAADLGLVKGIPVFGGGDVSFVNIGSGSTRPGDTHIYIGTSGWVSTFMDYQAADFDSMITGLLSAKRRYFNYYADMQTAGKCFE